MSVTERAIPASRPRIWPTVLAALTMAFVVGVLPRSYLMNDDEGLLTHLRNGTTAPFISPMLSWCIGRLYTAFPDVAWWSWWLYALHAFALDQLLRLLVAERSFAALCGIRSDRDLTVNSGFSQLWQDRVTALVVTASVAGLMATLTFTIASVLACGVALLAFTRPLSGGPSRPWLDWLAVGLLLAAGFGTRRWGLVAALVGVAPVLAAVLWRRWRVETSGWAAVFVRRRLAVALVPLALVMAGEPLVLAADEPATQRWLAFNFVRGKLSEHGAYLGIERRAPHLLKQAGWTTDDWLTFASWLFVDETRFDTAKLQRLRDTGGAPVPWRVTASAYLGKTLADTQSRWLAGAAVALLLLAAGGWLGGRLAFLFGGGMLLYFALLSVALPTFARFPYHVSQPLIVVAVAGTWLVGRHWLVAAKSPNRWAFTALGTLLIAGVVLPFLATWPSYLPDRAAQEDRRAFHHRVGQRYDDGAFVLVYGGGGAVATDPLDARPRPYDYVGAGWSIFSVPFYRGLQRLGVSRGAELFAAMAATDRAFIVTDKWRTKHLRRHFAAMKQLWTLREVDGEGTGGRRVVLLRIESDEGKPLN